MPDLSATVSPLLKRRDIFGFIQGQGVPRGTFNYRTRERSRLVPRFISMYDLGNPAAAILISSLLPLVNRSREKYACYPRLIRARVERTGGREKRDSRGYKGRRGERRKNGSICEFDLAVETTMFEDHVHHDLLVSFCSAHRE